MNKITKLALVATAAFAASTQAALIEGSVAFAGAYNQVDGAPGDLTTATTMAITSAFVVNSEGDLSPATLVSFMNPIGVNGGSPALLGSQLWKIDVLGTAFTFQVDGVVQDQTQANSLHFSGTGTLSDGVGGFDDTPGAFQLHFGANGSSFAWDSTGASVPDGGMTAALLGVGILGLGALRRKA
jgi:hypothetical protein